MSSISLVSVNIERSKHLDLVVPFLQRHAPDAVCLQELLERDVPFFERSLGMQCIFGPSGFYPTDEAETAPMMIGSAILSRVPVRSQKIDYYAGSEALARSDVPREIMRYKQLITCDIEKDGSLFRIATTHFTWTPKGQPSDEQREDMRNLLGLLAHAGEFVLTGDFNAPRGGEIFAMLADAYKDNVPMHYATSIDISMHYAGKLRPQELADKMVDGIFSTPSYMVSGVELASGVSDHCAVVATISHIV